MKNIQTPISKVLSAALVVSSLVSASAARADDHRSYSTGGKDIQIDLKGDDAKNLAALLRSLRTRTIDSQIGFGKVENYFAVAPIPGNREKYWTMSCGTDHCEITLSKDLVYTPTTSNHFLHMRTGLAGVYGYSDLFKTLKNNAVANPQVTTSSIVDNGTALEKVAYTTRDGQIVFSCTIGPAETLGSSPDCSIDLFRADVRSSGAKFGDLQVRMFSNKLLPEGSAEQDRRIVIDFTNPKDKLALLNEMVKSEIEPTVETVDDTTKRTYTIELTPDQNRTQVLQCTETSVDDKAANLACSARIVSYYAGNYGVWDSKAGKIVYRPFLFSMSTNGFAAPFKTADGQFEVDCSGRKAPSKYCTLSFGMTNAK